MNGKLILATCGAFVAFATACGSSTGPKAIVALSVTPTAAKLVLGSIQQLAATPTGSDGSPLVGRTIVWTSSDRNVATVSADGLVRTVSTGTTMVTATAEGKSATAEIDVLPMIASLTGVWDAASAGPLSNLQLQLTEANTESVTGQWSGYVADCTPLNSAQCQRSGTVVSGYRHGSSAQFVLIPSSTCGVANATITLMFARSDSLTGLITQQICNAPDRAPVVTTLMRQPTN